MNAWSQAERGTAAAAVLLALGALLGCAELSPVTTGAAGPRAAPDDSDLWNLAPAAADTIAEVDVAALRASPWTQALTESDLSGQREQSRRSYGYDPFTDADRLVAVAIETGDVPHDLTVLRGRFDPVRVGTAFSAANPNAAASRWRETPIWDAAGRSVALITPRTLVTGSSPDVRAAIDAAWGILPDAKSSPLGELRRAMGADRPGPAAFIAVNLTPALRARAAGFLALPAGLLRIAGRLDLGADLNLDFTGVASTPADAAATANGVESAARSYAQGTMIRLLGLAPILNSIAIGAEGTRLHGHVAIPVEQRQHLAEKLRAVLQMLAAARR